jgi:hypothetical protein
METPYSRKPPRLSPVFESYREPVYFVTFCTFRRQRVLASSAPHQALRRYAERGYAEQRIAVGRYVIMPDHVHLFLWRQRLQSGALGAWTKAGHYCGVNSQAAEDGGCYNAHVHRSALAGRIL